MKDFEVKPMFEGQVHERQQFKVTVEGNDFGGVFHEGDIQWFNPHPNTQLEKEDIVVMEAKVYEVLSDQLQ